MDTHLDSPFILIGLAGRSIILGPAGTIQTSSVLLVQLADRIFSAQPALYKVQVYYPTSSPVTISAQELPLVLHFISLLDGFTLFALGSIKRANHPVLTGTQGELLTCNIRAVAIKRMEATDPAGLKPDRIMTRMDGVPPPVVSRLGPPWVFASQEDFLRATTPQWCACPDLLVTLDITASP